MSVQTGIGLTVQQYYYYAAGAQDLVPVRDLIQRYFTEFDSSVDAHVDLGSPVNVTRVVMDVYSDSTANTGLPTGAPALTANQLQTIDFAHTGNIEYIGRNGTDYFNGYIANVSYFDGLTLIARWPLDEDFSTTNVARNANAVDGPELWSTSPTLGPTWSEVSTGVYSADGTSSVSNLTGATGLTNGIPYIMRVTVDSITQGVFTVVNGGGLVLGVNEILVTPTIGQAIISAQGSAIGQISSISFRQAPGVALAVNIGADDSTLFDQVSDGWTGPERWTLGEITAPVSQNVPSGNGVTIRLIAESDVSITLLGANPNITLPSGSINYTFTDTDANFALLTTVTSAGFTPRIMEFLEVV